MIEVQRISKDGLSKESWHFSIQGINLVYKSYSIYNRNTKREKWADEIPEPLSLSIWCKKFNKDEYDYYDCQEYKEYYNKLNPVLQKTRLGKTKLSGICAKIENMPKCPVDVALEAKKILINKMKVIYK